MQSSLLGVRQRERKRTQRTALRSLVRAQPVPAKKPFPITHVTECIRLQGILDADEIRPSDCAVFGDERLYTFYARPAYRIKKRGPLHNLNFAPVGFLVDPNVVSDIHPVEVVALDTGALDGGLLWEVVHSDLKPLDFALDASVQSAQQIAKLFFGSDHNYFKGTRNFATASVQVKPTDAEVVAYVSLISRGSNLNYDERATSVELHFKDPIPVSGRVLAIILPQDFLDLVEVRKALRAKGVVPLPYEFMPDHTTKEVAGRFYEIAAKFYSRKRKSFGWDW